jgi:hypothetical protein
MFDWLKSKKQRKLEEERLRKREQDRKYSRADYLPVSPIDHGTFSSDNSDIPPLKDCGCDCNCSSSATESQAAASDYSSSDSGSSSCSCDSGCCSGD